ncbi:hypothetical protein AVEN_45523-1 [Araneus ventricosus]|uniref:Uncharacterized protein n=1 Tax=Araneus ventricosus TaxID=182803 RepID=A0A4Y2F4M3_ARAVE|nr:hypothetical protein AVEN_45523-1 [Araneus ventricosus]
MVSGIELRTWNTPALKPTPYHYVTAASVTPESITFRWIPVTTCKIASLSSTNVAEDNCTHVALINPIITNLPESDLFNMQISFSYTVDISRRLHQNYLTGISLLNLQMNYTQNLPC